MVPKVSQQYASLVNKVPIAMQNFKIKKKYSLRASNNSREPPLAPSYVSWKKKWWIKAWTYVLIPNCLFTFRTEALFVDMVALTTLKDCLDAKTEPSVFHYWKA